MRILTPAISRPSLQIFAQRLDKLRPQSDGPIQGEWNRRFIEHRIRPFLHNPITQYPRPALMSNSESLDRCILFPLVDRIDPLYQNVGIEEEPTTHFVDRE